jgi:DNA-binding SARP family transcriptional activator
MPRPSRIVPRESPQPDGFSDTMAKLRLLGPIDVVVDGRSLDIGGQRQRVVLAMLSLNANRVTSVDQLVDAVWNGAPPPTARSQVHISISALRKLFVSAGHVDAIRTRPPGYALEVPSSQLDTEQFAYQLQLGGSHAEGGRLVEAAAALRSALALWRGPALDGVDSDVLRRNAALLDERRLSAIEELLRLDLELGRHEEVGAQLRALVGAHPLREKLHALLMLALYRCGRQAEALEAYRHARNTLVEEAGIDPGHELQTLERAILNRDPALRTVEARLAAGPQGRALCALSESLRSNVFGAAPG